VCVSAGDSKRERLEDGRGTREEEIEPCNWGRDTLAEVL